MDENSALMAEYATFLRARHLEDLAIENLRVAREMEVPILKQLAGLPDEVVHGLVRQGFDDFLGSVVEGVALAKFEETLRALEEDRLPGVARDAVEPSDLVLMGAAQRKVLVRFLPRFTSDQAVSLAVVEAIDDFYHAVQERTFKVFTRLREAAAHRAARLAAENEEITVQNEELEEEVERRTAELAGERRIVETIVVNVPTALAYLDRGLRYRWVNPSYGRLFGRDPAEFLDRHPRELFGDQFDLGPACEALRTGRPDIRQDVPFGGDGEGQVRASWWDYALVPHRDEAEEIRGVIVIAQDVSDRVARARLQDATISQLREVDRLKDEFLSVISHELRTPLNFIMGFASLLDDEVVGALNPEQRRYVDRILSGTDRMLLLVQDLLDFAAMQAGRFTLQRCPASPRALMTEVAAALRPLADQRGVALRLEAAPEELVMVDGARIVQVLTNLAANGLKFTPAGGVVTLNAAVTATATGRTLTMAVADTGIGIAADDLPKLFTRFQQLNMGSTREAGGTGLGLSIVKALVEAHGGTVAVESAPGQGSTFSFTIPLPAAG